MSSELQFDYPETELPTMEGKSPGVIWHEKPNVTVQCAVCFKTATGRTQAAVKHIMFDGDRNEYGQSAVLKYRRCRDCKAARRHLSDAIDSEAS